MPAPSQLMHGTCAAAAVFEGGDIMEVEDDDAAALWLGRELGRGPWHALPGPALLRLLYIMCYDIAQVGRASRAYQGSYAAQGLHSKLRAHCVPAGSCCTRWAIDLANLGSFFKPLWSRPLVHKQRPLLPLAAMVQGVALRNDIQSRLDNITKITTERWHEHTAGRRSLRGVRVSVLLLVQPPLDRAATLTRAG